MEEIGKGVDLLKRMRSSHTTLAISERSNADPNKLIGSVCCVVSAEVLVEQIVKVRGLLPRNLCMHLAT